MVQKKYLCAFAVLSVLVMVAVDPVRAQTTLEWIVLSNMGNAADVPGGLGSVDYVYRITKFEVTNAQYSEFLNAVADTDSNGLYSSMMGSSARGGIIQTGVTGSHMYELKASEWANKPVNFVNIRDAMRFVNWLHNGQPTGMQTMSTTESGVYLLGTGLTESRSAGARYFLPTEDEWYKAAYHHPAVDGGDPSGYWDYPTRSNTMPVVAMATPTGDIANPGTNVANYSNGADWPATENGNVTTVGSASPASASFYGTYDQGGNVWELTETLVSTTHRRIRGGSWNSSASMLESSGQSVHLPSEETDTLGFRVASLPVHTVPAVSNWGMLGILAALLLAGKFIFVKETPARM